MQRKEEKKLELEREKERKRVEREEKKKNKEEMGLHKAPAKQNSESEEDVDDPEPITSEELKELTINSWVVVPYVVYGKKIHFPGQIKQIRNEEVSIKFLERRGNKYMWPAEDNIDESVPLSEIVQVLSAPHVERRVSSPSKKELLLKEA